MTVSNVVVVGYVIPHLSSRLVILAFPSPVTSPNHVKDKEYPMRTTICRRRNEAH